MKLIDNLKAGYRAFRGNTLKPFDGINLPYLAVSPVIAQNNQQALVEKAYALNSTVYSIVKMITRTAAVAPWGVYKIKSDDALKKYKSLCRKGINSKNINQIIIERSKALELVKGDNKLQQILDRPNPQQTWSDYIENRIGFRLITGNSYTYAPLLDMGANKGLPQWLFVLPSQFVLITPTATWPQQVDGYKLMIYGNLDLPKEEILQSKYWNPLCTVHSTELYGFPPLAAAWLDVLRDNDAKKASLSMFQNMGARGIVYVDDAGRQVSMMQMKENKEQADATKKRWAEEYKGYNFSRINDIIVSAVPMGYVNLGMDANQLKILEASDYSQDDIANCFGVSSILLNNHSSTTDNNVGWAEKHLITHVVLPELVKERDDHNNKFQTDWGMKGSGLFLDFDITVYAELQEDLQKVVTAMAAAWWIKGNEKRSIMNYDIDSDEPMMDDYLIPSNLVPLNMADQGQDGSQDTSGY